MDPARPSVPHMSDQSGSASAATSSSVGSSSAASSGSADAAITGPTQDPNWADQVTELIVDSVDKVRERTTGPILEIAKGTVQGVVGLMILTPIIVLAIAGMVRLLNWAIPGDVWIAYALMGLLLVLSGLFLWSKRFPRDV